MDHVERGRFNGSVPAGALGAEGPGSMRRVVKVVLAIWFAIVLALGAGGAFVRPAHEAPLPILLGCLVPLLAFGAAYGASPAFRGVVLGSDLRLGAAVQSWRVGGLGFLALYANGVLPGLFALPAGLGDIVIGVTAPWVALALVGRPGFAASRPFVLWNLFGILDLVVAVGAGVLGSGFLGRPGGSVTTAPMAELPLVLVPAFFVPVFVMLHVAALLQARRDAPARPVRDGEGYGSGGY